MIANWIGAVVAASLTVMILSYLINDNPLFRIAIHLFVGVAGGYVAAVAWWQVLLPKLILPLLRGSSAEQAMLAVPLLLSGLLLMKAWPPLSRLGSPALGFLVGVASAVAIGGAVKGTLIPQLNATLDGLTTVLEAPLDQIVSGGLVLLGLITSLAYFQFSAGTGKDGSVKPAGFVEFLSFIGGIFIAITLGVLFAGVYSAALTALIERLHFLGSLAGIG